MLRKIKVDGFRSLLNFEIELRPDLNVIVGANGTGKSNFISFLDFLGTLIGEGLNAAIAVAQGAGSMFSRERFAEGKTTELTFSLSGILQPASEDETIFLPFPPKALNDISGSYTYNCTISYLASIPAVFISAETLTVVANGNKNFTISRTTTSDNGAFKTRIAVLPEEHKLNKTIFRYLRRADAKQDIDEYLATRVQPERSILAYVAHETPSFSLVYSDLIGYKSVNIDPSVARRPTPVGSITTLQSNGEGLAGALYQLKNGVYFPGRIYNRFLPSRSAAEGVFKSIVSWCREVNPAIDDVRVDLDVMEAQLRPYMNFRHGLVSEVFPFNRISDGTVKWLALTTVLFAEPGLSIIEEPENFLHPFMQESFIALCRQALKLDERRALVISTHSPTLLDCCRPDELTLFELKDGATCAMKIADREQLEKKLNESRFGLGHYYKIGALYGEDSSNR